MTRSIASIRYRERDGSEKELVLITSAESVDRKLASIATDFDARGLFILGICKRTYEVTPVARQHHDSARSLLSAA